MLMEENQMKLNRVKMNDEAAPPHPGEYCLIKESKIK